MSSHSTDTADLEATYGTDETDSRADASGIRSTVLTQVRNGALPILTGTALLVDAVRSAGRSRRRAGLRAFAGGALLGIGLRKRRSSDDASGPAGDESSAYDDTESIGIGDEGGEISDDARANRERSDVLHGSETNPRGVSGEPDVETETASDEGDVRFTTDRDGDASPKPHLEGTDEDPRRAEADPEADDDHVEVDLSEAAMADEASEATGPDPEQAYPSLEGTDPEPMAEEAPPRDGHEADSAADSEGDDGER
ncbi:hypothetical protein HTZ84_14940 [Haloterrigena sp. SYSU A558-1]|uniref:DUF3618 domain-containing protein n=1 Tax=Haloterrigena gelatinilytica TaxID=2741724 RepID=A0ABX2LBD6_9EURY|nr:hypothetical protein [Haloterrigena gelatinilytica]NUC73587.1 hypothetical protein [Haloterrigena gelatinilytica]